MYNYTSCNTVSGLIGRLRWSFCSYFIRAKSATLPVHRNLLSLVPISNIRNTEHKYEIIHQKPVAICILI